MYQRSKRNNNTVSYPIIHTNMDAVMEMNLNLTNATNAMNDLDSHHPDAHHPDADADDEEHFMEFTRVHELLKTVQEKEAELVILRNKTKSLSSMLEMVANNEMTEITQDSSAKVTAIVNTDNAIVNNKRRINKKYEYYRDHKEDEDVIEQISLFKDTFPNIRKAPWQFVKLITDHKYKLHYRK